jgi:hypothetical protein
MDDLVQVPRSALAFVLEHGRFDDEGPQDAGWSSPEMRQAIEALQQAVTAKMKVTKTMLEAAHGAVIEHYASNSAYKGVSIAGVPYPLLKKIIEAALGGG